MSEAARKTALVPELNVSDVAASRRFYVDVLGFEVRFERPEEGFVYLTREGAELMRDAADQGRTWFAAPAERPFGRGVNLQIWTDSVDALYARVRKSGATVFLEIEEKWYRWDSVYCGNRQFIVMDPDGYLLRFAQDLGERSDPPS
jgi:catechol 2,3-dioxygenase-like lactoylglutathione lyase family enzyme